MYKQRCALLATSLWEENKEIDTVLVFGELFGGAFPQGKPAFKCDAVQTELLYRPDLEFYAFDVAFSCLDGEKEYLPYERCVQLFETNAFEYWARPLCIGSYRDMCNFPIEEFCSTVSMGKSAIEGIVVKNLTDGKGEDGFSFSALRVVFKLKTLAFQESVASAGKSSLHLTLPRLDAVISKLGKQENAAAVIQELMDDILSEEDGVHLETLYVETKNFVHRNQSRWLLTL